MKFSQKIFIFGLLALGLFFRLIHFPVSLNFSAEQGAFSEKAYDLYKAGELTLVGPPISFRVDGRLLFQGSITYYFQLLFLWLGNFDPIVSSLIFTIFSVIMSIFLYFGVKNIVNTKWAVVCTSVYLLLPLYIDYTKFFWNPNFQIVLLSWLVFCLGRWKKTDRKKWLFLSGVLSGALLMFHYQFVLVISIWLVYLLICKTKSKKLIIYKAGVIVGFLPMILFEVKNDFYTIKTIWFYLNNWIKLSATGGMVTYHYYLSIGLSLLVLLGIFFKNKINNFYILSLIVILVIIDSFRYLPYPSHGFGMISGWNYLDEKKINEIIVEEKLDSFNVVNLPYDTLAQVQKYLLKVKGIKINKDNYRDNRYLFVINKDEKYMENPAYEVGEFKPNKLIKTWEINKNFNMYLLEKVSGPTGN